MIEKNTEYIEREAAKRAFQNMDAGSRVPSTLLTPEEFAEYLDEIPAEDVVPVKHGHWRAIMSVKCICCNSYHEYETPYCPNCGAKMDGDNT